MRTLSENFARTEDIDAILAMRRVAVVGLSSDTDKDSNMVARYLMLNGYEVTPINPRETEVLGRKAYGSLLDLPEPPEVVDVFRRSEFVPQIVEDAISAGAKAIWLQFDVVDYNAARRARDAGMLVVMDRCIKIEHGHRR